ncbi:response regulator [Candidatus Magnetaquicoccus inordinatus]|uniref:response regulator n=1 Tax=Candidatus Magnetaquicoccus inordinatus TaxID=2496818 RepID=UPI00187D0CB9|nr:response regulator [Candidatus Magnetaquicoccus inordinatus]
MILVVDDNERDVRRPIVRQLSRVFGQERIAEANHGQEALELLSRWPDRFAVIILDIMMPIKDGLSTCQEIRNNPNWQGIYIIMLTGRDGGLPEGLDVGADIYLHKPVSGDDLIAIVRHGLKYYRKEQKHSDKEADLSEKLRFAEQEKLRLQMQKENNAHVEIPAGASSPAASWVELVKEWG